MLKKDRARNSPLSIGEKMTKIDYSTLKKNRRVETPVLPKKQPVVVDAFIKGVDKMPINLEDFERHNVGRFFPQLLEVEGDVNKAKKAIEEAYKAKKNVVTAFIENVKDNETGQEYIRFKHEGVDSKSIVIDNQMPVVVPLNSYQTLCEYLKDIVPDCDVESKVYSFRIYNNFDYKTEGVLDDPGRNLSKNVKFIIDLYGKVSDDIFVYIHDTVTDILNCDLLRKGYNFVCDSITLDYNDLIKRIGHLNFTYDCPLFNPGLTWEQTKMVGNLMTITLLPLHSKDFSVFSSNPEMRFCKVSKNSKLLDMIDEDGIMHGSMFVTKDYERFYLIKAETGDVYLYRCKK